MEKLSISSISKNIFRTDSKKIEKSNQANCNQTNPFGVSFKGKMITADVFEKARSESNIKLTEKIANRSKLLSSAVVGSINNFASNISARLNSVASFGRRIKNNISNFWNTAKNTNITFDMLNIDVKDLVKLHIPASRESLAQKPVSELELMLNDCISKMSA